MCLAIKKIRHLNEKPKVARRNIRCYKVFALTDTGLASPFMGTPWHLSSMIGDKCIYANEFQWSVFDKIDGWKWYAANGIHSFRSARAARRYFLGYRYNLVVIKCLIPKESKYWVGKRGEYCSDRLQVLM